MSKETFVQEFCSILIKNKMIQDKEVSPLQKAFKDSERDISDDELEDYLREMIEVNIPESNDYQIIIEIKDENNYL